MNLPKQAAPIQRLSLSSALSKQKGIGASGGIGDILRLSALYEDMSRNK